jgi:hypothetical protein
METERSNLKRLGTGVGLAGAEKRDLFDQPGNIPGTGVNLVCQASPGMIWRHLVEQVLAGTEENNQGIVDIVRDIYGSRQKSGGIMLRAYMLLRAGCHSYSVLSLIVLMKLGLDFCSKACVYVCPRNSTVRDLEVSFGQMIPDGTGECRKQTTSQSSCRPLVAAN